MIDLRFGQWANIIKDPQDTKFPRELIAFGYYGYLQPSAKRIVLMSDGKKFWYRIYFSRIVDELPNIYQTLGNIRGDILDLKPAESPTNAYKFLTNNFILGPIRELRYI